MSYIKNERFNINVGFNVNITHVNQAVMQTNKILKNLPSTLFQSIDYKTTSAMIGSIYCDNLALITGSIVNPIEKGHPDILPITAKSAKEEDLRNYHEGLEIKCTVGNIESGANLRAGQNRINKLTSITWQAHHQEVSELMGLVWDFFNIDENDGFNFPIITSVFYTDDLTNDDWGAISGTTGRNTKVSGMKASGKNKMGRGWVTILDNPEYIKKYTRILNFRVN